MSDAAGLWAAMGADPDDDRVRLVYADWLDEHRNNDKDKATAEYLRLTCGLGTVRRAGAWLRGNWQRLSPTLAAGILYPARRRGGEAVWTVGSVVDLYYDPPSLPGYERMSGIRLQLHFARGFCVRVRWRIRGGGDDPFPASAYATLVQVLVGTDHHSVRYEEA